MTANSTDACERIGHNFMDYALDTNNNKAFVDVRDGLKPGARACLWEMYKKGYSSSKPHIKSAKIDGGVAAAWWAHGTTAIYETFVRMSQDFTENVPEVGFHGNNGNQVLGGDAYGSDRYTEARLSPMTEEFMLDGVDSNAVDMIWNFTEDEQWPSVLPSVFPRLLVNGTQGIGVSISSFMCGHNLSETVDLIVDYLKSGKYDDSNYLPDFPTGGTLVNPQDMAKINQSGKGKVVVESKYDVDGRVIRFTELPFQVYLEPVLEEIKKAIESGKVTGVKNVVNASDKNGLCLEVECKQDADSAKVVAQLMAATSLRKQYNVIQRAIVSKTPELLSTKRIVDVYIAHNLECIRRVADYTKTQLTARIEVLQGFTKAIASIDDVVAVIRQSKDQKDAKESLVSRFGFSEAQAKAILDMRLAKLSSLESVAVEKELDDKALIVAKLETLLSSEKEQKKELISKLKSLKKKYGNERRTKVEQKDEREAENMSSQRYDLKFYQESGTVTKVTCEEGGLCDNDTLVCLNRYGKVYRLKVGDIPENDYGYQLSLAVSDDIVGVNPPNAYFVTRYGKIKRIRLSEEFDGATRNKTGMSAIKLAGDDEVAATFMYPAERYVKLTTNDDMAIKFALSEVPSQGKSGSGVKAIDLAEGDVVVNVELTDDPEGVQKRGGKGHKSK